MSCRSARASSAASGRTSGSKAPWSSCCTRTRPRRAARATCRRTRWSSTAAISSSHPSTATHAFGRPERAHLCSRAWCDSCRRAKKYCADAVSDGAFVVTLRSVVGVSLSLKVLTRTYELYLRFTAQVQRKFVVARMHSGGSTVRFLVRHTPSENATPYTVSCRRLVRHGGHPIPILGIRCPEDTVPGHPHDLPVSSGCPPCPSDANSRFQTLDHSNLRHCYGSVNR